MHAFFKSSCEVRQRDPLLPSLFILTMDWLLRTINAAIAAKDIKSYYTLYGALNISHLMFADDILIFSKDCPLAITNLMQIIRQFCNISVQVLNPSKCHIFF